MGDESTVDPSRYGSMSPLNSNSRRTGSALGRLVLLAFALVSVIAAGCSGSAETAEDKAYEEYDRGLELEERGNLTKAFEAYSKAIEIDRTLAVAYSARAHVYYLHDNLGLALDRA